MFAFALIRNADTLPFMDRPGSVVRRIKLQTADHMAYSAATHVDRCNKNLFLFLLQLT